MKAKLLGSIAKQETRGPVHEAHLPIDFLDVPPVPPRGWGSIRIEVTIDKTSWQTSMFPLKKQGYFVPIKQAILKAENLKVGDKVTVSYQPL